MNRPTDRILPAPPKPKIWEIRHGSEIWYADKMITQCDFRPDLSRVDRTRFLETVTRLLNSHSSLFSEVR